MQPEFLVPGLIFLTIGIVLIGLYALWPWPERAAVVRPSEPLRSVAAPAAPSVPAAPAPPAAAVPAPPAGVAAATPPPPIAWPALVAADAGELDPAERRRVLEGLGIVGDGWAVRVLAAALREEQGPVRLAAIDALGGCFASEAEALLRASYRSDDVDERYAAVDGASRRGDLPLLEDALDDAEPTVRLAAAYGLQRAGRVVRLDPALRSELALLL